MTSERQLNPIAVVENIIMFLKMWVIVGRSQVLQFIMTSSAVKPIKIYLPIIH